MEKRKNSLGAVKMCRFCLTQNESLRSLYDRNRSSNNSVNLHLKILSCVSIEIFPSDNMPTFICDRCKFFMNLFYEYKQIVRQADETILQYVRHGTAMEIISWPTSLTNVFRNKVVNTVVEGGATVHVTSQDNSDSDDDEGNVYNIKIGDTPDNGSTACVKVITSKDEKEIMEDSNRESGDIDQDQDRGSDKGLEDGCWPCDECNCTYPLQQLLHIHKTQKHRVRTVQCDLCDAKFFSKYDLAAHHLRHTDKMPFECIVCGKRFKRLILLKRHEKQIHSDLPQQVCPSCPASFLTFEELEEHQKRHIRIRRPYDCLKCGKKYHDKTALQRHQDVVHNKTPTYCCEYCPERFVSVTKLARHVRSHAGDRPYPCKFCDKCFTKSHHYTRHLRLKHHDVRRSGGAFGDAEQYRCEQCDDTFSAQDDLIYHSAIHATQNLTCPLCQEKFEDVDAVTAHIKSHVNGEEYSCDFCELVFTSKEKLEIHSVKRHEDEMQDMSADDSSIEIQGEEDDDDDNEINVKDKGDHMLIEIKKAEDFMIDVSKEDIDDKHDATNSEESEPEITYLSTIDALEMPKKDSPVVLEKPAPKPVVISKPQEPIKTNSSKSEDTQTAGILRKAEEMKRKVVQQTLDTVVEKKEKPVTKVETSNTGGASDKSLRLLEKELQDLKRTNSRTDITKNPTKSSEIIRNKRPQLHTSTPKLSRVTEEKKLPLRNKSPALEKKVIEKRVITKENKEPKETKEPKNNNGSSKEDNKDREIPNKSLIKNGSSIDKNSIEEGIRRSTRPSKIKNYAKMIRDRTQVDDNDDDDDTSEDDEDYIEEDKSLEARFKSRRSSQTSKPAPKPVVPTSTPVIAPRKRGRPRKEVPKEIPAKIKKDEIEDVDTTKANNSIKQNSNTANKDDMETDTSINVGDNNKSVCKTPPEQKPPPSDVLVSPTGQTLKKVPIKALPPGVKPLPLPINARPMATGELCEMQIGKKLVKVQKIVMTKAEVEAMAKKGLVEMKDGTMVLKQGIKLPTVEQSANKPTINSVGDGETEKDSNKTEKATPTRCDLGDES